jgi:hypothetical protein
VVVEGSAMDHQRGVLLITPRTIFMERDFDSVALGAESVLKKGR